ncbi:polysaccharide biosynthesis C-terminal domain-containing protein [Methylobacterium oryzisoli]|uniref:polysaccharide biosynthesis C-terminal domain-containing protein n=1 Tax=Methylobacterium oryzisoli TaxID=3385502 RepID=UPI003891CF12
MTIVLTFICNAGFNLLLGLVVAGVLGPEEYGRFAVAATAAVLVCTALFDWLRLSTTRFSGDAANPASSSLKASLEAGYGGIALAILCLALVLHGLGIGVAGVPVVLVAVTAVANARFEFRAAEARALFRDRTYLWLVASKNSLALVLGVAAAACLGSAAWVIAVMALCTVLATLTVRASLDRHPAPLAQARRSEVATFARYGLPIVGANLVYQAILLTNRSLGVDAFGLAAAGQLSLATDLTIRLLVSVGAALDVFLFQLALRRRAESGEAAGHRQVATNMLVVGAVLCFLGTAYVVAMPALQALFIPAAYRGAFGDLSIILVPGTVAFCFAQFGLNPIFQLSGRTGILIGSAVAALAVDAALVWLVLPRAGIEGLAVAHAGGLLAGALAAGWAAARARACWPPARDALAVLAATAAMAGATWPLRSLETPWLALIGTGLLGTLVYGGLLVGLNAGGLRDALQRRMARPGTVGPARGPEMEAR